MALINKEEVGRVLRSFNPWWVTKEVPTAFVKRLHRTPYHEVLKLILNPDIKRAMVLSGPRRVGKTTILYQLAHQAMRERGFAPQSVLYLTLEHPILKLMPIDKVLELYDTEIAKPHTRRLILLDELQYIERPTQWLKILVDQHPDWQIVVTGSASILFKQKDKESGTGRWLEVPVPTLSFFEYVLLREYENKATVPAPQFSSQIRPTALGDLPPVERRNILLELEPIRSLFNSFLLQGGFPESALVEDLDLAQKLLREDIVDKVIKRDMAAFYGVQKLSELEKLFVYLCIHSGGMVNMRLLSKELGLATQTVYTLFGCLEAAHLIRKIKGIDLTGKKALKGKAKWYIVDASMRNAVLLKGAESIRDSIDMGIMVESATINQLVSYSYEYRPRLGHWHGKGNKEVDLVVDYPKAPPIAVEVKYRESFTLDPRDGISQFLSTHPGAFGIVVCKNGTDFAKIKVGTKGADLEVTFIPAYAFLYLLGHYEYERYR